MKYKLVPVWVVSSLVLSLGLVLPAHGQFGGQGRGGSQQGGGHCSKGPGGGSQTSSAQSNSMMRPFGQNPGQPYPYAQSSFMQYPCMQNTALPSAYSQSTSMPYSYTQNAVMQSPYAQNSNTQYPSMPNNIDYVTMQYAMQNPAVQPGGNTGPLDAAQMQYLLQLMQYQSGTSPTQSAVQTTAQPTTNAQRIQQRRTAAQSTNVLLLRSVGP